MNEQESNIQRCPDGEVRAALFLLTAAVLFCGLQSVGIMPDIVNASAQGIWF